MTVRLASRPLRTADFGSDASPKRDETKNRAEETMDRKTLGAFEYRRAPDGPCRFFELQDEFTRRTIKAPRRKNLGTGNPLTCPVMLRQRPGLVSGRGGSLFGKTNYFTRDRILQKPEVAVSGVSRSSRIERSCDHPCNDM